MTKAMLAKHLKKYKLGNLAHSFVDRILTNGTFFLCIIFVFTQCHIAISDSGSALIFGAYSTHDGSDGTSSAMTEARMAYAWGERGKRVGWEEGAAKILL